MMSVLSSAEMFRMLKIKVVVVDNLCWQAFSHFGMFNEIGMQSMKKKTQKTTDFRIS